MAAYTGALVNVPQGVNQNNLLSSEHELAQALANLDTLTLDAPAGFDYAQLVPVLCVIWSAADPRVLQTAYAMTSYDKDTGKLVITATGAVADNSTVFVLWAPVKVGS